MNDIFGELDFMTDQDLKMKLIQKLFGFLRFGLMIILSQVKMKKVRE